MSERVSLEFLAARLAAVQDGLRDLRESHESLGDRVTGVETTISNLGNQVLRTLALDNRRITRLDGRMDALQRRMERLEEAQARLADMVVEVREAQLRLTDMVADTRLELAQLRLELTQLAADQREVKATFAAEQGEMKAMLAEVLRRLPPAPG